MYHFPTYSLNKYEILFSAIGTLADQINAAHMRRLYPNGKPARPRDALDDLLSAERKAKEKQEVSSDLYSETDEDLKNNPDGNTSDSSGNGTRFAKRTGVFSLDFPESPKVPKGKGKRSKGTDGFNHARQVEVSTSDSERTTVLATQTQELTVTVPEASNSDSDFVIQPSGFITERKKRRRSSSSTMKQHKNKQRKVTTASYAFKGQI